MNQITDEKIASCVQKGKTELFGILVERYEGKLLRYGKKFLLNTEGAEDIVQEVFIKAYINIQGFNAKRKFSSWLYRIAHNEFINAIRKKRREPLPFFDPDVLFPHPLSRETADRETNEKDLKEMLNTCLNALDPKYREPLTLYYFEEMSYEEISEILHIPQSTVGVRLSRGKTALKKILNALNKKI